MIYQNCRRRKSFLSKGLFTRALSPAQLAGQKAQCICSESRTLEPRTVANLPASGMLIVENGTAWISSHKGDTLLSAGSRQPCQKFGHAALIGPVDANRLIYKIERAVK